MTHKTKLTKICFFLFQESSEKIKKQRQIVLFAQEFYINFSFSSFRFFIFFCFLILWRLLQQLIMMIQNPLQAWSSIELAYSLRRHLQMWKCCMLSKCDIYRGMNDGPRRSTNKSGKDRQTDKQTSAFLTHAAQTLCCASMLGKKFKNF